MPTLPHLHPPLDKSDTYPETDGHNTHLNGENEDVPLCAFVSPFALPLPKREFADTYRNAPIIVQSASCVAAELATIVDPVGRCLHSGTFLQLLMISPKSGSRSRCTPSTMAGGEGPVTSIVIRDGTRSTCSLAFQLHPRSYGAHPSHNYPSDLSSMRSCERASW